MQTYQDLSDVEKLQIASECVAVKAAIPEAIRQFLVQAGLYTLVVTPVGDSN